MKTIIECALLVLFVLFMGRTEISFSPFCIWMPGWQNVVGWLLLLIVVGFLCNNARRQGYDEALQDVIDVIEEVDKEQLQNKEE